MMTIPEIVDVARVAVGGSQAEVARRLGVAGSAVSAWYAGKGVPGYESCLRLADLTGIPARDILEAAGHDPSLLKVAARDVRPEPQDHAFSLAAAEWTQALQERGVKPADWPRAIHASLDMFRLIGGGSGTTRRPFPRRNGTRHSGTGISADPSEVPLPPGYYRSQDVRLLVAATPDRALVAA